MTGSSSLRVRCPFCGADEAKPCTTSGGRSANPHNLRWDSLRRAYRSRESRMRLIRDDPRFGLAQGDVLICVPYPYDAKWTVLRRESDGFDPECNQYAADVEWIGWAS